ncbi:hypothetical protein FXF51_06215 [Nonomuraea sp. PA05]|uniref:hypothetical protein n=1 Tax=Nonomuraea sp. PA05 TaxID=2604466 RepID=UPI0011D2FA8B|nr:hypothetical protein [Nonomuraea sp. PA05]TYB69755.1 hypothetical protein FXF51_06215 [Nonomuraea sp. PA05]
MKRFVPLAEHPFELLVGLAAFLSGAALVFGAGPPTSLNATLPPAVAWAWGGIQLLAGALIIVGIVIRYWRPALLIVGFRMERAGLWPLAAAATVYGIVVVGYAGVRAIYPAGVLVAVAVACAARAVAVSRLEKTIRKHTGGTD